MRPLVSVILGVAVASLAFGCRQMPTAPSATAAGPAPLQSTNLSGTWTGTGADAQGPEALSMTVTQAGASVSGTVVTKAVDPADGSCASCHKNKIGTFSGTVSGTTLTLNLTFPAGSDAAPTPMCGVRIAITAPTPTSDRLAGTYTGADSCEGPFTDGTLTMTRQAASEPAPAAGRAAPGDRGSR